MEPSDCSQESSTQVRFILREIVRKDISQERKKQREAALVGRRHIQDYGFDGEKLKPSDIEALAVRLKKKQGGREGCYKDLYSLQSALSYSGKINGAAFVKVDGAIAALVRDVSGKDSSLQVRATYCCANLALAGPDIGFKVSKAVVPYLMNHLQSMNQILLEASLRAIGSLAASGVQAYKVMEVQGIFQRLISIMQQYCLSSDLKLASGEKRKVKLQSYQVMEAALYAASHCVNTCLQDNPKLPEIGEIAMVSIPLLRKVDSLALPRLVYLYFLISCSEVSDGAFLNEDFLLKMILLLDETLMVETEVHNELKTQGLTVEVITFIVRILGNLSCSDVEWVNGALHVHDCPWSPIVDPLKLCIEQEVIANASNSMY
ncbi:hypothetical protein J437_LFUL012017 [Ladona fulva]|uniref:Uncharacterized protein n=1 Tax=Ladona fulva TaxID=123851 RepID=A0A8K0P5L1_LADFU|nr:hypothetical protein J437_LFUL012017 [Ladona fulva]